jgi:hypothetical protein
VDGLDETYDETRRCLERKLRALFFGRLRLMSTASKDTRNALWHRVNLAIHSSYVHLPEEHPYAIPVKGSSDCESAGFLILWGVAKIQRSTHTV